MGRSEELLRLCLTLLQYFKKILWSRAQFSPFLRRSSSSGSRNLPVSTSYFVSTHANISCHASGHQNAIYKCSQLSELFNFRIGRRNGVANLSITPLKGREYVRLCQLWIVWQEIPKNRDAFPRTDIRLCTTVGYMWARARYEGYPGLVWAAAKNIEWCRPRTPRSAGNESASTKPLHSTIGNGQRAM